jgi:acyl-CoA thioesterase YciA
VVSKERLIYSSPNGDRWFLTHEPGSGQVFIRHDPNAPSAGRSSDVEISEFLVRGGQSPEHQALLGLIETLVEPPITPVSNTAESTSVIADQPPGPLGAPHLRTIAMPRDANASGDIFGGWTVSQMDLAAGSYAADQAQGRVATVAIDAMHFLRPVSVGDEVSCYCSLVKTGDTSATVKVETWARGRGQGRAPEKVTEGVFTFVAVDEQGHPRKVPDDGGGRPFGS